jgi:hypothetical protein
MNRHYHGKLLGPSGWRAWALLGLACLLGACGTSQKATVANTNLFLRNHFYFTSKTRSVQIPFRFVNNLMVIPMHINGSDTMRFILDTGVKTALITGLGNSEVQLRGTRKIRIRGLGDGDDLEALLSYGNRFDILPTVRGDNHDVLVLTEDIFTLSTKLGVRVHGIIGYDVFKNFVAEIDYAEHKIMLYLPERYRRRPSGQMIPLVIDDGKPYLETTVEFEDGSRTKVKLLVDTGASYALSLDPASSPDIVLPGKTIDAYLGQGLSGDIHGKIGRVKSIELGKYKFKNLITSFPDSSSLRQLAGATPRNGQLGGDILKRFYMVVDYPNSRLYLKPNGEYGRPFYYNLSGIELATPFPGLPIFKISEVAAHSPAAEAGLQRGDEVIEVNGQKTISFTLNQFSELFHSKPGKKVIMKIQRGEQVLRKEFVLRQPI